MSQTDGHIADTFGARLTPPFPRPRPALPLWLQTAHVVPTPAQLARLDAALSQRGENGRPARPIMGADCRRGR